MRLTVVFTLILIVTSISPLQPTSRGAEEAPPAPATQPLAESWAQIGKELGVAGEVKDDVYTVTILRKDMDVNDEDGNVPAGVLKTEFQFYRCDCGKMNVAGQFCLYEYESNDVIDALREGRMKVVAVAPMLRATYPTVTLVRFQGGGGSQVLAQTLKNALQWTGEARMAPATKPVR